MTESKSEMTTVRLQLQEEEEEEEQGTGGRGSYEHRIDHNHGSSSRVWEIEEENSSDLFEINHHEPMKPIREFELEGSVFSFDVHGGGEDCVYVGVGKMESSMEALTWTLKNAIGESTTVYLIHIFPEIHHIPSPLGKLPKSQVSPAQVENYMAQESGKRRQLLDKYINACSASKVKVDTILIESDMVAKAFLDLIPVLNIRKLVLGASKSGLRRSKYKRGSGIADQIVEDAPQYCEVKIICNGKEANDRTISSSSPHDSDYTAKSPQLQDESITNDNNNNIVHNDRNNSNNNDSFACMCFKSPKVM